VSDLKVELVCLDCDKRYNGVQLRYRCDCSGTLDVRHDLAQIKKRFSRDLFDERRGQNRPVDRSGVWRFRELILPVAEDQIVTRGEGNTFLYDTPTVARYAGVDRLRLKHEGENPTGSFKDRGMTVGVTAANVLNMKRVACASTGNTSASMASYAAIAGMRGFVFIPEGNIAYGKLSQALAYGSRTLQLAGDFDAAMRAVEKVCNSENIYLLNSINPFRIEGQKAIAFELLQDMNWEVPDWIVLPGGNLGNNSAISKGLQELFELGWIDRLPRLAVVQAAGANPLYTAFASGEPVRPMTADTIATAIRIGDPVSWKKSLRGIAALNGVVTEVNDQEIVDAKAIIDAAGVGAEPASCATVAGLRRLVREGIIPADANICGILTGHLLKDPDVVVNYHRGELKGFKTPFANAPVQIEDNLEAILEELRRDG
jgi:threonine synthase